MRGFYFTEGGIKVIFLINNNMEFGEILMLVNVISFNLILILGLIGFLVIK